MIASTLCTIPLYGGYEAIVDAEDYDRMAEYTWYREHRYRKNGSLRTIYARARIEGKMVYMHRLILNASPDKEVDHIDHDGLNNSKGNLRSVTRTQNSYNSRKMKGASSRYKGVSWDKYNLRWEAYITQKGKQIRLGRFDSELEAYEAYKTAANSIFGEYAYCPGE